MKQARNQTKPLARKDGLVIQELPDEVLVYDLDRDRAHCLNETAAFVWQRCDGRTSTSEIARSLGRKVNAPVDERVVSFALDQLGRNHLMATPVPPPLVAGLNRREMVRALGLAAAVAVPVVASIVAPTPAQATTCVAAGGSCAAGQVCCAGLTCVGGTTCN